MSSKEQRAEQIERLRADLRAAKDLSIDALSRQIGEIGFLCLHCGECCAGEDNSVVVFPFEIRRILETTGLQWLDAVEPPEEGEWDRGGCFHTLEWRLKKKNGACKFYSKYEAGTNGDRECQIYGSRPLICSTYPFYLDRGVLHFSECRGLGGMIEPDKAREMAELLILRFVTEIREAIALLEKYEDFERGGAGEGGRCIVHDSEGEHCISVNEEHVSMKDPNRQSDIRQAVDAQICERIREMLLAEAQELRKETKNIGIGASEFIRQDRDAG